MKFQYYDLGFLNNDKIIQVSLQGTECNVFLVNSSNFQKYKNGNQYTYYGGHTKSSLVDLGVPNYDHWYLVVDLGGYAGSIKSSVKII
ncbi:MAG: DUF1883 domain-containing protein [Fusobacteriaceae bacterium]